MKNDGFKFERKSLVSASVEEVKQRALDYTSARFKIVSGTPEVVLARPVISAELPNLGLGTHLPGTEIPMMLVVVHGNIDTNLRSAAPRKYRHTQVEYIAYVFDLMAGFPMITATSHRGGAFRSLLNNPNLPEVPPEARRRAERPSTAEATPEQLIRTIPYNRPYGSISPSIESIEPSNLPSLPTPTDLPPQN